MAELFILSFRKPLVEFRENVSKGKLPTILIRIRDAGIKMLFVILNSLVPISTSVFIWSIKASW